MMIRKICRPPKHITTTSNSLMLHSSTYLQFGGPKPAEPGLADDVDRFAQWTFLSAL